MEKISRFSSVGPSGIQLLHICIIVDLCVEMGHSQSAWTVLLKWFHDLDKLLLLFLSTWLYQKFHFYQEMIWTNMTYRKASLISSSVSVSFIFFAIIVRNSGKSIVPLPKINKLIFISVHYAIHVTSWLPYENIKTSYFLQLIIYPGIFQSNTRQFSQA